jgi:hypothetical protein
MANLIIFFSPQEIIGSMPWKRYHDDVMISCL